MIGPFTPWGQGQSKIAQINAMADMPNDQRNMYLGLAAQMLGGGGGGGLGGLIGGLGGGLGGLASGLGKGVGSIFSGLGSGIGNAIGGGGIRGPDMSSFLSSRSTPPQPTATVAPGLVTPPPPSRGPETMSIAAKPLHALGGVPLAGPLFELLGTGLDIGAGLWDRKRRGY